MSERNSAICKLCQKALAHDEASNRHCKAWCGDDKDNDELQAKGLGE